MGIGIVTTKYGKVQGVESQEKNMKELHILRAFVTVLRLQVKIDGRHQKTRNVGMV